MQSTDNIKVFSPNPVLGSNYHIDINRVMSLLKTNFGSKYNFILGDNTIHIEDIKTGAKNCVFQYSDQMNYASVPWTISKELTFKQYYSCGNSEQSIYNPNESEIIAFATKFLV